MPTFRTAVVAAIAGLVMTACSSPSTPASNPAGPTSRGTGVPSSHAPTSHAPTSPPATTPDSPHPTEFNPPGDIPDNAVFVDHTAPGSSVHFTVPEGWARSTAGGVTTYTDKYNSISIEVRPARRAPTVASARRVDVPELRRTTTKFQAGPITEVSRQHGTAVHIAYTIDSAPNPVTGKVVRDAVERFEFWHAGEEAILTLTGPDGADNVDPWQAVSDSLHWQ